MNERCEKHNITRCTTCMALERKKLQTPVLVAPPEITGAPPPDIEQMDSPALRAEVAAATGNDFELATNPDTWKSTLVFPQDEFGRSELPVQTGGQRQTFRAESFDTLPVDDSHASKVMRAAAAYATASKDWAQNLARVEKIKSELLKAEALLHEALVAKETSESDLKTLVTGDIAA